MSWNKHLTKLINTKYTKIIVIINYIKIVKILSNTEAIVDNYREQINRLKFIDNVLNKTNYQASTVHVLPQPYRFGYTSNIKLNGNIQIIIVYIPLEA